MTTPETLGKRLAFYRRVNGLSQRELGERVALSSVTIRHYEKEHISPTVKNLSKLADALGIRCGHLLGELPLSFPPIP